MPEMDETGLAVVVGRAIAKRRIACGLTQEQVAERLRIGVEAVSRMERGVSLPTVVRLGEFADIFQCKVADLVTETSGRASDQARYIESLLTRLSGPDRLMVVTFVEQLTARLSNGAVPAEGIEAQVVSTPDPARPCRTSKASNATAIAMEPDLAKIIK
jgi:transcriptional regulator with XRE-family HTH domain